TPVAGSTLVTPSISIDADARRITLVLDRTSRPALQSLIGTRLVVSDLASPRVTETANPSTTKGNRVRSGQSITCPAGGRTCSASIQVRVEGRSVGRARFRLRPG